MLNIFAWGMPLPWHIRMKIMLSVARGLAFLHEEVKKPLIFWDFKTSNILLDVVTRMLIAFIYLYIYIHTMLVWSTHGFFSIVTTLFQGFNAKLFNFGLAKDMLLWETWPMCWLKWWEHKAMQPVSMSWQVSIYNSMNLWVILESKGSLETMQSQGSHYCTWQDTYGLYSLVFPSPELTHDSCLPLEHL